MTWIQEHVHFDQPALETTLLDYVQEVEHMAERMCVWRKRLPKRFRKRRRKSARSSSTAGFAGSSSAHCGYRGCRTRFPVSLPEPAATDGLQRSGFQRVFSGNRVQRGGITKTGNAHLRRVVIESAWAYQHRPWIGGFLLRRQRDLRLDPEVKEIAWKAQWRLHTRYKKLAAAGKKEAQIVTAVGRELLGFLWAIAVQTEAKFRPDRKAA